jgi:hypothetical protein
MAIRLDYETKAGHFSEAETFLQAIEHLRLAQEAIAAIGHHRKENGDTFRGNWILMLSEAIGKTVTTITNLASGGTMVQ